ncbi:trans-1,2-dihydrobenzene-1,2-diol dehydrogenase-like [Phycodurus eques]|uniref:trans-1,2-dihydrobenzene-1,2-diol dehydrogenase-like n=1 Tax=Phycodurus eques TaxID=693459 RepID=UPI002ACE52B9|nr:trans-1,2-dihydrobenzene-1,2-diol dehydrogenase-like [Phycodurus eques]
MDPIILSKRNRYLAFHVNRSSKMDSISNNNKRDYSSLQHGDGGLCGAGKISHDFCVALVWKTSLLHPHSHYPAYRLSAIASRSLERAQDFAKRHGVLKVDGTYEELAHDPNVDIVYVGVLHTKHWRVGLSFLNAGKNLLREKSFAMNYKQVKDLAEAARRNNMFLMEAIWSRCFPAHAEVGRRMGEGAVGDAKLVKAYFGSPRLDIPRSVESERGGGALLDIDVYCVQFVLMAFDGERPESVRATGVLLDSGVDDSVVVVMKFSRKRMATCTFAVTVRLPNNAVIGGTKGSIQVRGRTHCPNRVVGNGKVSRYSSARLSYEAEDVRQCLLKGLKESPRMPLADSILLTEIMEKIRKQVGVIFSQDSQ